MQNNAVFEETKEYFYQYFLNLFLEFCMHKNIQGFSSILHIK